MYAHCSDAQTSVNSGSRSLVHTREILEFASPGERRKPAADVCFVFAASYKASEATRAGNIQNLQLSLYRQAW